GDLICMLVMLPSTICAGMVLPLIIHLFYRGGYGETTIGKVYAVNTFGGIIGIIGSVWLLMPLVGVRLLVTTGGLIDIAIGLYVLYFFNETSGSGLKRFLPATCAAIIAAAVPFGRIDPALAASGVFRNGTITKDIRIVSHRDGRTATVSLYRNCDNLVLCTNGKPDAAVNVRGGICGDEYTMALCGVLPTAISHDSARAAVIGMGSGMTAHYLLYDPTLAGVDIIEIEPAMAVAARRIGDKVSKAFSDERVSLHIDDAKSFLSTCNRTYDMIISEPSNPWVSGVSGLFSREFFGRIKNHLNDDGILVQWFHRYESDLSIVVSIFRALREHFPNFHLYFAGSDCITVAAKSAATDMRLKRDVFSIQPLAKRLEEMGFMSLNDLAALRFSSEKTIDVLGTLSCAPPNSDYEPYVDLNAVKYRYIDDNIKQFDTLRTYIIPLRKIIESDTGFLPFTFREKYPELSNFKPFIEAKELYHELVSDRSAADTLPSDVSSASLLLDYASLAPHKVNFDMYFSVIIEILEKTLPYLSAAEMRDIWNIVSRKTAAMKLSIDDELWMRFFQALCRYDVPAILNLSIELLPQTGPIDDDYVHRMLLTSLMLASSHLHDTDAADNIYQRFIGKDDPGMMIALAKNWRSK
ncbi:MAG: fused MFS/spermidine synthase, partial [Chitinispirillaceae bacterium]|nr:fused MFS/spermidine synthase [Chitinispirillaceae bacterium]